jgi:hypothetical protein
MMASEANDRSIQVAADFILSEYKPELNKITTIMRYARVGNPLIGDRCKIHLLTWARRILVNLQVRKIPCSADDISGWQSELEYWEERGMFEDKEHVNNLLHDIKLVARELMDRESNHDKNSDA